MKGKKSLASALFVIALCIPLGVLIGYSFIRGRVTYNSYLCLNAAVNKKDVLYKNMLVSCKTRASLPEGTLTNGNINDFSFYEEIANSYESNQIIFTTAKSDKDAINIYNDLAIKIDMSDSIEMPSQSGAINRYIIGNDKVLYYTNDQSIFNKDNVKSIAIINECCAGGYYLLVLTENGNVYLSDQDLSEITSSKNISFSKKGVSGATSIIMKLSKNQTTASIYAVDSNDNLTLIK